MPSDAPQKEKLLKAFLKDAVFDGWSDETLAAAAAAQKIPAAIFDNSATNVAVYFSDWADDKTIAAMKKMPLGDMRIRDRIFEGVKTRLEILQPYKQSLSLALAYMARPPRNFYLAKIVWRTADKIWWMAGDNATDYNHYTKRGLLSGVLTATTLYWLNDTSDDHEKTWAFLDQRINNVLKLGKALSSIRRKT